MHNFLIAELEAYGFSYETLMHNYLTDRKHRTKVKDSFSDFIELLLGDLQSSILVNVLFNIYICNLSFFVVEEDNATSYTDDTTPYSNGKKVVTVML